MAVTTVSPLHDSIGIVYDGQKTLFRKCINMAFASAGTFWIIIYALRWIGLITEDDISSLRHGQTLPYFIMLSLWGTEFMREASRLKFIMNLANTKQLPPEKITAAEVDINIKRFAVLKSLGAHSWIMPTINIVGLIASYLLILNQYRSMVSLILD